MAVLPRGRRLLRQVADTRSEAEQVAAQVNAQLTSGAPTLAFRSAGLPELRQQFLDYHEHVLQSSLGTVRQRPAPRHLEDFVRQRPRPPQAHEIRPNAFAAFLRRLQEALHEAGAPWTPGLLREWKEK